MKNLEIFKLAHRALNPKSFIKVVGGDNGRGIPSVDMPIPPAGR